MSYINGFDFIEKRYEIIERGNGIERKIYPGDVDVVSSKDSEYLAEYMYDNDLDLRCYYYDTETDKEIRTINTDISNMKNNTEVQKAIISYCLQSNEREFRYKNRFIIIGHEQLYDKKESILYYGDAIKTLIH